MSARARHTANYIDCQAKPSTTGAGRNEAKLKEHLEALRAKADCGVRLNK